MLLECEKDSELNKIFAAASLTVPESSGLSFIARMKGFQSFPRIPGIDLMRELCAEAVQKNWSVFLMGAKPGVADEAKAQLQKDFPGLQIVGTAHGYFNDDAERELLIRVQKLKPHLLFVAMNIPHQEKWISRNSAFFSGTCVMGVGGSFDVLAGRLKRAPQTMQALGLEWLYRWVQEPWRTRRMLKLPVFLIKALVEKPPPIY